MSSPVVARFLTWPDTPSSQYRTFSLNMMWLLMQCVMYVLASDLNDYDRDAFGTPNMSPLPRNGFSMFVSQGGGDMGRHR